MKTRWYLTAMIGIAAWCSTAGLLHAQDTPSATAPIAVTKTIWSGIYTDAQADRGARTYYQVCYACHGRELEGDDSEGVTPLAGDHFMTNWDTHTVADLVKRIHAQPNDEPGDIDVSTATDLVAFILAFNKVPSGKTELSTDRLVVSAIGFTAYPPAGAH